MSDIEKHESQQRRCQVGNPAPLYVALASTLASLLTLYSYIVDCLVLRRRHSSSLSTTHMPVALPFLTS